MTTLAAKIGALTETTALPDPGPIADGEARFLVEHFALTANNVYGVAVSAIASAGSGLGYFRFL
jgi:hypothetical protein